MERETPERHHLGIFFVYECRYNQDADTVSLIKLLYVGEAENLRDRINSHPLYATWKSSIKDENEICFATAYVDPKKRTLAKACFIYDLKPVMNSDYKQYFPFEETSVTAVGKTRLLKTNFIVPAT